MSPDDTSNDRRFSRRAALKVGGLGAGAAVLGTMLPGLAPRPAGAVSAPVGNGRVAFFGTNQAGILTPAPQHLSMAVIDLTITSVSDLRQLLQEMTKAAAAMTQGQSIGGLDPAAGLADSGEVLDETPANLTITVGFGPSLFNDRFGLGSARPAPLADLPRFSKDQLDRTRTGGDLFVQACADSAQVADHAIRNLMIVAKARARLRWVQRGFLDVKGAPGSTGATPRNLQGFRDGTANLDVTDANKMNRNVWANTAESPQWMNNGSYAVIRRIRNLVEVWDVSSLSEQENVIGRRKANGAPFGGTRENDTVVPGNLPVNSHVRLANPRNGQTSEDERILRRGFNYADGLSPVTGPIPDDSGRPQTGLIDAGLMFIAFQRDPRRQFVPMQTRLDANDALNEYIVHNGSGVFAMVPGVNDNNDYWGRTLLDRRR